jgi:hypothetical protein
MVSYQRGGHTNYRIWIPGSKVVKESPHVTFKETEVYGDRYARGRVIKELVAGMDAARSQ